MILRSHEIYEEAIRVNPAFSAVEYLSIHDIDPIREPIVGRYSRSEKGKLIALFIESGEFFLHCSEQTIKLPRRSIVKRKKGPTGDSVLEIRQPDGAACVFQFIPPSEPKEFDDDPTAFVEDEDFDFTLFVENLFTHPLRLDVLTEQWKSE